MDVVDEQLDTIGKAILAQTLGCARCHDHKFDPIPTRDYYAMAGILHNAKSLEHGNVSKWLEIPLAARAGRRGRGGGRHEKVIARLEALQMANRSRQGPEAARLSAELKWQKAIDPHKTTLGVEDQAVRRVENQHSG